MYEERTTICNLIQGGSTFFLLWAKNSFPIGPEGQENFPGTVFENIANFYL
jgi:hypothetical protein